MKKCNDFISDSKDGLTFLRYLGNNNSNAIFIFLPGFGAFKENYIVYISRLKEAYRELYILDLPLQGSKGVGDVKSIAQNIEDFLILLESENTNYIDLGGHSLGALGILFFLKQNNIKIENNSFDRKIRNILLYALIPSFKDAIGQSTINLLENRNKNFVTKLLNLFINGPQVLFSKFYTKKYFNFSIRNYRDTQYFNANIKDHKDFLNRIKLEDTKIKNLSKNEFRFPNVAILTQIGTFDWIIKPWEKQNKIMIQELLGNDKNIIIYVKNLGHFLSSRFALDLDLNTQMLTNLSVINNSLKFINNEYNTKELSILS